MHATVHQFVSRFLNEEIVKGARVLEVGSYNVNGSVKEEIVGMGCREYIGADLFEQPCYVDVVVDACELDTVFPVESFDIVVCCEMFEHCEFWEKAARQIESMVKPGGYLLVTTRSKGFPLHCYPADHWRYTPGDIVRMFPGVTPEYAGDDFDLFQPGVFYFGQKPPLSNPSASPSKMEIPYHSRESHDIRWYERNDLMKTPEPLRVFWHIAAMGDFWKNVFHDQLSLLSESGLSGSIEAVMVGSEPDLEYIRGFVPGAMRGGAISDYEFPTLDRLYGWAKDNPDGAVLYMHTKGVSQRENNKQAWRILMEEAVVRNWESNLNELKVHDMVGVDWQNSQNYPHYCGNFWMARNDWIGSLMSPRDFQRHRGPASGRLCGNPWDRIAAEMWLGSEPWHIRKGLVCEDANLWVGENSSAYLCQRGRERLSKFSFDPIQ